MVDREMGLRRDWALSLMTELEKANVRLKELAAGAGDACSNALAEARQESGVQLKEKLLQKKEQVAALRKLMDETTNVTNDFHAFRLSDEAQKRPSYPFLLTRRAREANATLASLQSRMQSLILKNRLLEEEIRHMADAAHREALSRLESSEGHTAWAEMLQQRQLLLDDLCLLLPTIPATTRCVLDPEDPGSVRTLLENVS